MLRLQRPEPSLEALKAMAASGSSGVARKAQAAVQHHTTNRLADELARAAQHNELGGSSK